MSRLTIRLRFTVVYGGMFLVAGIVLLALTYLLMLQSMDSGGPKSDGGNLVRVDTDAGTVLAPVDDDAGAPARVREQLAQANAEFVRRRGAYEDSILGSLLTRGLIALGVVGVTAVGFGWLVAGRVLRPVHTITATARRIASANSADHRLHERIGLTGPRDEIRDLADTFDDMLERLDRSFDAQRRFVANASHELRTPLVINHALVEAAIGRPDASADARRLGAALLTVNDRHRRLIDGMLALARSEQGVAEQVPVDLADLAEYALDVSETEARAAGVETVLDRRSALTRGDPVLLEHLVTNIVHNAIRHNVGSGGRLWVVTTGPDAAGTVSLVVTNTGPVVPPDLVDAVFEPFRRLDADRVDTSGGVGLGLSIARAVARAHGGGVPPTSRSGGGLEVRVTLPATQPCSSMSLCG
jgi:signal transduction histidine kinase